MNKEKFEYIRDNLNNARKMINDCVGDNQFAEDVIDYITGLLKDLENIKFYIEQSDIKNMLWGKEILKIIGDENE